MSLILWHALNAALLDVKFPRKSLKLCIGAISILECLAGHCTSFGGSRARSHSILLHIVVVLVVRHGVFCTVAMAARGVPALYLFEY